MARIAVPASADRTLSEFVADNQAWLHGVARSALPGGYFQEHEDLKANLVLGLTQSVSVGRARSMEEWQALVFPVSAWKARVKKLVPLLRNREYRLPPESNDMTKAEGKRDQYGESPLHLGVPDEDGWAWYLMRGRHEPTQFETPATDTAHPAYVEAATTASLDPGQLLAQGELVTVFFRFLRDADADTKLSVFLQFANLIGGVIHHGRRVGRAYGEKAQDLLKQAGETSTATLKARYLEEAKVLRARGESFVAAADSLAAQLDEAEAAIRRKLPLVTYGWTSYDPRPTSRRQKGHVPSGYTFRDIERAFPQLTRAQNIRVRQAINEAFQKVLRPPQLTARRPRF